MFRRPSGRTRTPVPPGRSRAVSARSPDRAENPAHSPVGAVVARAGVPHRAVLITHGQHMRAALTRRDTPRVTEPVGESEGRCGYCWSPTCTWTPRSAGPGRRSATVLRANLRATLDRIAALARQSRADALLCGGDLFDQARATPKTLDHLRTTFAELEIPVHLTPGDDDWYGPSSPYRQVDWSPNVHVFTEARLTPVTVEDGVTLWGAAHDSPASTGGLPRRVPRGPRRGSTSPCSTAARPGRPPPPCRTRRSGPSRSRPPGWTTRCSGTCTRPSTTRSSPTRAIPARSRPARPDRGARCWSPSATTARWSAPATTSRAAGCTRSRWTSRARAARPRCGSGSRRRSPAWPASSA